MFKSQPRAFGMIFLLEVWERFGYYTVQGILTLYFIRFLKLDTTTAYYTFGAFSALVYGLVPIGGYLGDEILGTKRTILLGLITLAGGYLFLALANQDQVYLALGMVCVGNGIFKANPSNLLSKCYEKDDDRLHGGFTLYYMAVNLGSTFSLFLGPFLADTYGYFYAYFLSFIGILLGICNFLFQQHYIKDINTRADNKKIKFWLWNLIIIGILVLTQICAYLLQHVIIARNLTFLILVIALIMYVINVRKQERAVAIKMILVLVLMIEAVAFFILYQQMPTSLNLFAIDNVQPYLFGIQINPQSFQALNPIWIILLSPVLAVIYTKLNKKEIHFNITKKFALGMTLCGISFLLLYFARFFSDANGIVSYWWLIASYFFQSSGELLVSALGVAMVAELVPVEVTGFVMGIWFLVSALAMFLGGYVASFAAIPRNIAPGLQSLFIYTKVFAVIGITTLFIALIFWLISPFLTRILESN